MSIVVRPSVHGQDDVMFAGVYNRVHAADDDFIPATVEDFRDRGESPNTRYHNFFIAELDGTPAGYASALVRATSNDKCGTLGGPRVVPELRRRGVGTALARAVLADLVCHDQVAAHASGRDRADINDFFASLGFRVVRRFSRMERSLADLHEGVGASTEAAIAAVEFTPEMIPVLVELENETFSEHFNRPPETVAGFEFAIRNLARQGIVASEMVASIAGTPVGFISYGYDPSEIASLGRNHAGLWDVGVLKPWRGRGIGRALLLAAMRELRARGMDEVELNVDETNVTGALHVYERLGFRVTASKHTHRIELTRLRAE